MSRHEATPPYSGGKSRPDSLILSIAVPTKRSSTMPAKLDPKLKEARDAHKAAEKNLAAATKAKDKAEVAYSKAAVKLEKIESKLAK